MSELDRRIMRIEKDLRLAWKLARMALIVEVVAMITAIIVILGIYFRV